MIAPMVVCAVAAALAVPQDGDVRVSNTAELTRALAACRPGTRVLMAPGDYDGFRVANLRGTAERAIAVAAADPKAPPRIRGSVHVSDVEHFRLEDVVFEGASGNGLNVDDGGTFDTPSHHVTLTGVIVRDCGGRGNDDGIKLSGVDDFRLERCTVDRWGRGGSAVDMVGCHRGTLVGCTFRDRATDSAATGVQAKGGSSGITIRSCRFEDAGQRAVNIGGSTGLPWFRPRPEGFEAKDVTVEGCTFTGSMAPIAFVGVDGSTVRWNTFHRPAKWVIRILQETVAKDFVPCRKGVFANNLVAYRQSEVRTVVNVGPHTAPETFEFADNFWFCIDAPARSIPSLPMTETRPVGGEDPRFRGAENLDFRVDESGPARGFGAQALPSHATR